MNIKSQFLVQPKISRQTWTRIFFFFYQKRNKVCKCVFITPNLNCTLSPMCKYMERANLGRWKTIRIGMAHSTPPNLNWSTLCPWKHNTKVTKRNKIKVKWKQQEIKRICYRVPPMSAKFNIFRQTMCHLSDVPQVVPKTMPPKLVVIGPKWPWASLLDYQSAWPTVQCFVPTGSMGSWQ